MDKSSKTTPHFVDIPRINDPRGNLSFIQHPGTLPFKPGTVGWMYNLPGNEETDLFLPAMKFEITVVALSGAADATVGNESFRLDRAYRGLFIPKGMTVHFDSFVTNTVILVIAGGGCPNVPPCRLCEPDAHSISKLADVEIIDPDAWSLPVGSAVRVGEAKFDVQRVFYLYDVPADSERGGHSHHKARELIVAASGAFDVILDDGMERRPYHLDRPYKALYVPAGLWRELGNFTGGAVCLVLTTEVFDENDYVRDYQKFTELTAVKRK